MKALSLAIVMVLAAFPAHAISRYNSQGMTCAQVQSTVRSEGAVILRYTSRRNPSLPLYDRYVAHGGFCAGGEYAASATVPTSDTPNCYVRYCRALNYDDDILFR